MKAPPGLRTRNPSMQAARSCAESRVRGVHACVPAAAWDGCGPTARGLVATVPQLACNPKSPRPRLSGGALEASPQSC